MTFLIFHIYILYIFILFYVYLFDILYYKIYILYIYFIYISILNWKVFFQKCENVYSKKPFWMETYFKIKMFWCLEWLRSGSVYILVTGCNCEVCLVTATINIYLLRCDWCSSRKMSGHNDTDICPTAMREDWKLKGWLVAETSTTAFFLSVTF